MDINIKGKDRVLKYTFNSFRYMEDLDMEELSTLDKTPFKIGRITETLFRGALNNDPRDIVSDNDILNALDELSEEGKLIELFEHLSELLENSAFFSKPSRESREETKEEKIAIPSLEENKSWYDLIIENILPDALMIGVNYELFWTLDPHSLSPFVKAFELQNNHNDVQSWRLGMYIQSAIASVLDKKVKYPEEPFSFTEKLEHNEELRGKLNNQKVKNAIQKRTRILNKRF